MRRLEVVVPLDYNYNCWYSLDEYYVYINYKELDNKLECFSFEEYDDGEVDEDCL